MYLAIALLIVVFFVWVIYNANCSVDIDEIHAEKPDKSRQKSLYVPFDTSADQPSKQQSISSYYSGLGDDLNGEGSDLIRKFSGKRAEDDQADLLAVIDADTKPKKRARKLVKVSVSGSIAFNYIDSKGELSDRVVRVKEVDARHLSGYCSTARAYRTFLLEGILTDVTDTDTGEVMPVLAWIKQAKAAAKLRMPKK